MSFTISVPADLVQSAPTTDIGPIPAGTYSCTIFEAKAEEVRSGKNAGKPRWNVQLRVAAGQHENRRLFAYIPLYVAGDFWKTQSFFGALEYDVKGEFSVPEVNDVLGKAIDVKVTIREAEGDYSADNNVAGFVKVSSGTDALTSMGATEATGDVW
jgi:hypothetical protein